MRKEYEVENLFFGDDGLIFFVLTDESWVTYGRDGEKLVFEDAKEVKKNLEKYGLDGVGVERH